MVTPAELLEAGGIARASGRRVPNRSPEDDQLAWIRYLGWKAGRQAAAADETLAETRAAAVRVAALARGGSR